MAERNATTTTTTDFEQQPSYLTIYGNRRIQWNWKLFDYFSLMIIIPSCLNLMEQVKVVENNGHFYVEHGIHPTQMMLYFVYYVFLFIEIVIRVKGSPTFMRGQHAYLKNFFNLIDVLVFVSWTLLFLYDGYVTLIPLRALRIIYVFRDVAGFRLIWKTLSNALKSMGVIVVVILVIILHLATLGALLYSHHFNICFTTDVDLEQYAQEYKDDFDLCLSSEHFGNVMCFKNYTDCETLEKEYHLGFVTFEENIFKTMFVVFQIMTLEGWSGITLTLTYEMVSEYRWYYFMLVVFIGGYFALNLVTGLIVTEFMREKSKMRWSIGDNQVGEDIYPKNYNPHGSGRGGSLTVVNLNSDTDEFGSRSDNLGTDTDLRNRNASYHNDYMVYMRDILSGAWSNNLILVLISINAFCLAIKHHEQSVEVLEFIQYVDLFFVSAFLMEILIKVIVERWSYFNSIFNWFDLIVVLTASFCFGYFNDSFGLTSFRVIHLFQLFTYTGYSKMYVNFVTGFKRCLSLLMPLLVTYAIFDVIFASFGVDLIWYEKEDQYRIIAPYGTFQTSLVTTFQVMSGESWTYIMYKAVAVVGPNVIYLVYFTVTMVTGKLILSNILLPITMAIVKHTYFSLHPSPTDNTVANIVRNDASGTGSGTGDYSTADESGDGNNSSTDNNRLQVREDGGRGDESEVERRTDEEVDYRRSVRQPFLPYNTLFVLTRRHWLRKTAHSVVNWYYFDLVMMLNVFFYACLLSMLLPSYVMCFAEAIYTTVAIIELILKVIDVGFVLHPGAYLTSGWNVFDLVALLNVIAFNIVRITSPLFFRNSYSMFGFWRSIRVVRLLRMFVLPRKYFPRLQPACEGAIKSMKNFVFIFIIYIVYLFMFSVVAVYLFSGQFHLCENAATSHNCKSHLTYETEETHNGTVISFKREVNLYDTFHFNNLLNAMVTLFAIQNGQDWIKIMELITDFSNRTTVNGDGSIHITVTIFFFVFLVVFSFFFIKLFTALVICTYDEEKSDRLRKKGFNKNQADCVSFVLEMESHKKYIPVSRIGLRRKAWDIVNASCFEEFIMIIIALNALLFMMTIESDEKRMAYFLLNTLFSIFYVIECVLKITAYKFTNYWKSWWNRMDLVIVVSDVIDVMLVISMAHYILAGDIDEIAFDGFEVNFLRTFHLLKAIKYIKPMYIRRLLWACRKSFNAIPHTFYPFGILLFVYAVVGEEVFTCYNHPYNSFDVAEFQTLGRHFGFHDISSTFLLLIRTATGENWLWTMNHAPLVSVCGGDGVTPHISIIFTYAYFISFVILSSYIMMNLFPAMIVDNFSNLLMDNSVLGEHHLSEFVTNWTEYDPKATGKIHFKELFEMLKKMSPPLGLGAKCPNRTAYRKLMRLNIPVDDDGKVGYKATLFALVRDSLRLYTGTFTRISDRRKADIQLKKALRSLWPHTDNVQFNLLLPPVGDEQLTIGKLYAGCLIVDYWRTNSRNRTTNDL